MGRMCMEELESYSDNNNKDNIMTREAAGDAQRNGEFGEAVLPDVLWRQGTD